MEERTIEQCCELLSKDLIEKLKDKSPILSEPSCTTSGKIFTAIPAVMEDMGIVAKNKTGKQIDYKFRSIDDVYNALHPALAKNKVFILPTVQKVTREAAGKTARGTAIIRTILDVVFTIFAEDGSYIQTNITGEALDMSDKGLNKAMAIAFKYLCFQVFCIPTEEMLDPDAEKIEPVEEPKDSNKKSQPAGQSKPAPEQKPAETPKDNPEDEKITEAMLNTIKAEQKRTGVNDQVILAMRGVKAKKLEDLTVANFKSIMNKFKKTGDMKHE